MEEIKRGKRILVFLHGNFFGCFLGYEQTIRETKTSEWMIRKRIADGKETKNGYTFDIAFN